MWYATVFSMRSVLPSRASTRNTIFVRSGSSLMTTSYGSGVDTTWSAATATVIRELAHW